MVSELPARVLRGLGRIATFLFDAGKRLVEGFINGIKAMFSAVVGVAGDLVSSLGSAVTGALGIGSPSKVAHQWGLHIGQGLANGITASHAQVGRAAGGLVAAANAQAMLAAKQQVQAAAGPGAALATGFVASLATMTTPLENAGKMIARGFLTAIHPAATGGGLGGSGLTSTVAAASGAVSGSQARLAFGERGQAATVARLAQDAQQRRNAGARLRFGEGGQAGAVANLAGHGSGTQWGSSHPIIIQTHSLVPGSQAELQAISGAVANAHRRTGRAPAPRHVRHGRR